MLRNLKMLSEKFSYLGTHLAELFLGLPQAKLSTYYTYVLTAGSLTENVTIYFQTLR
jgi:hypothetical protein